MLTQLSIFAACLALTLLALLWLVFAAIDYVVRFVRE